jgi:hypothetical protein
MRFARSVFAIAAAYGFVVMFPMYFNEERLALEFPPALTHAEYYYSFIGVTLVWQMLFVLIAFHPERYRTIMLFCVGEKLSLLPMFFILNPQGRFPGLWIIAITIDLLFASLFLLSYVIVGRHQNQAGT